MELVGSEAVKREFVTREVLTSKEPGQVNVSTHTHTSYLSTQVVCTYIPTRANIQAGTSKAHTYTQCINHILEYQSYTHLRKYTYHVKYVKQNIDSTHVSESHKGHHQTQIDH